MLTMLCILSSRTRACTSTSLKLRMPALHAQTDPNQYAPFNFFEVGAGIIKRAGWLSNWLYLCFTVHSTITIQSWQWNLGYGSLLKTAETQDRITNATSNRYHLNLNHYKNFVKLFLVRITKRFSIQLLMH